MKEQSPIEVVISIMKEDYPTTTQVMINWHGIIDFLNECEEQDWELDSDDIRHILKLDFEYIRKQNSATSLNKGNGK